ncbi:MAG: endonuclease/exonuclease/phosphatase family protein [Erysipelotrichaceae bacterium]
MMKSDIKVMTFNLRYDTEEDGINAWSKRMKYAIRMIHKHTPDILAVQELTDHMYFDIFPYLIDYEMCGEGRDRNHQGEKSAVFVKKDLFHVIATETVWLSGHLHKAGDMDLMEIFPRICTRVEIESKTTHQRYRIMNVHLAVYSEANRQKNVRSILKYYRQCEKENQYPTVLLGDFNAEYTHSIHKKLAKVFTEGAIALAKPYEITFNGFGLGKTEVIDFIYTDRMKFIFYEVDADLIDQHYPSDHNPVIAILQ